MLTFLRKKKKLYESINIKNVTDNKKFWKTVKPLFSEKHNYHTKINLIEEDDIISNDADVADIMNTFFSSIVENLEIEGYSVNGLSSNTNSNSVSNIITKFKDHPSIIEIKDKIQVDEKFCFSLLDANEISDEINALDKNKPTSFNNITIKILIDSNDISSPFITATIFMIQS